MKPTLEPVSSFAGKVQKCLSSLIIALLLMLVAHGDALSCNLSTFTVNSLTPVGTDTLITTTICVGGGRTGSVSGANGETRSFGLRFYGGPGAGFNVLSFSPSSLTSFFGACTNPGANIGPQGAPFNAHGVVMYIDPGYYSVPPCVTQPFACVTSTALCGNVYQNCFTVSVLVTRLTDSVCVFGVEGGGNPLAGCGCSTMGSTLRLGAPLIVWGDLTATAEESGVLVSWTSLQEFGAGTYHLERQVGAGVFEEIATLEGEGATAAPKKYTQMDRASWLQGEVKYRLRFVDQNGQVSMSSIVGVNLPVSKNFSVRYVYPSPVSNIAHATMDSQVPNSMQWMVVDVAGKIVGRGEADLPAGESQLELDFSGVLPGTYFLKCQSAGESVTRKILKL